MHLGRPTEGQRRSLSNPQSSPSPHFGTSTSRYTSPTAEASRKLGRSAVGGREENGEGLSSESSDEPVERHYISWATRSAPGPVHAASSNGDGPSQSGGKRVLVRRRKVSKRKSESQNNEEGKKTEAGKKEAKKKNQKGEENEAHLQRKQAEHHLPYQQEEEKDRNSRDTSDSRGSFVLTCPFPQQQSSKTKQALKKKANEVREEDQKETRLQTLWRVGAVRSRNYLPIWFSHVSIGVLVGLFGFLPWGVSPVNALQYVLMALAVGTGIGLGGLEVVLRRRSRVDTQELAEGGDGREGQRECWGRAPGSCDTPLVLSPSSPLPLRRRSSSTSSSDASVAMLTREDPNEENVVDDLKGSAASPFSFSSRPAACTVPLVLDADGRCVCLAVAHCSHKSSSLKSRFYANERMVTWTWELYRWPTQNICSATNAASSLPVASAHAAGENAAAVPPLQNDKLELPPLQVLLTTKGAGSSSSPPLASSTSWGALLTAREPIESLPVQAMVVRPLNGCIGRRKWLRGRWHHQEETPTQQQEPCQRGEKAVRFGCVNHKQAAEKEEEGKMKNSYEPFTVPPVRRSARENNNKAAAGYEAEGDAYWVDRGGALRESSGGVSLRRSPAAEDEPPLWNPILMSAEVLFLGALLLLSPHLNPVYRYGCSSDNSTTSTFSDCTTIHARSPLESKERTLTSDLGSNTPTLLVPSSSSRSWLFDRSQIFFGVSCVPYEVLFKVMLVHLWGAFRMSHGLVLLVLVGAFHAGLLLLLLLLNVEDGVVNVSPTTARLGGDDLFNVTIGDKLSIEVILVMIAWPVIPLVFSLLTCVKMRGWQRKNLLASLPLEAASPVPFNTASREMQTIRPTWLHKDDAHPSVITSTLPEQNDKEAGVGGAQLEKLSKDTEPPSKEKLWGSLSEEELRQLEQVGCDQDFLPLLFWTPSPLGVLQDESGSLLHRLVFNEAAQEVSLPPPPLAPKADAVQGSFSPLFSPSSPVDASSPLRESTDFPYDSPTVLVEKKREMGFSSPTLRPHTQTPVLLLEVGAALEKPSSSPDAAVPPSTVYPLVVVDATKCFAALFGTFCSLLRGRSLASLIEWWEIKGGLEVHIQELLASFSAGSEEEKRKEKDNENDVSGQRTLDAEKSARSQRQSRRLVELSGRYVLPTAPVDQEGRGEATFSTIFPLWLEVHVYSMADLQVKPSDVLGVSTAAPATRVAGVEGLTNESPERQPWLVALSVPLWWIAANQLVLPAGLAVMCKYPDGPHPFLHSSADNNPQDSYQSTNDNQSASGSAAVVQVPSTLPKVLSHGPEKEKHSFLRSPKDPRSGSAAYSSSFLEEETTEALFFLWNRASLRLWRRYQCQENAMGATTAYGSGALGDFGGGGWALQKRFLVEDGWIQGEGAVGAAAALGSSHSRPRGSPGFTRAPDGTWEVADDGKSRKLIERLMQGKRRRGKEIYNETTPISTFSTVPYRPPGEVTANVLPKEDEKKTSEKADDKAEESEDEDSCLRGILCLPLTNTASSSKNGSEDAEGKDQGNSSDSSAEPQSHLFLRATLRPSHLRLPQEGIPVLPSFLAHEDAASSSSSPASPIGYGRLFWLHVEYLLLSPPPSLLHGHQEVMGGSVEGKVERASDDGDLESQGTRGGSSSWEDGRGEEGEETAGIQQACARLHDALREHLGESQGKPTFSTPLQTLMRALQAAMHMRGPKGSPMVKFFLPEDEARGEQETLELGRGYRRRRLTILSPSPPSASSSFGRGGTSPPLLLPPRESDEDEGGKKAWERGREGQTPNDAAKGGSGREWEDEEEAAKQEKKQEQSSKKKSVSGTEGNTHRGEGEPPTSDGPPIWAVLLSLESSTIPSFHLRSGWDELFSFGRSKSKCDATVSDSFVSSVQFTVSRTKLDASLVHLLRGSAAGGGVIAEGGEATVVTLKDLSGNGTYVNVKKIGKDKSCVLYHNSLITFRLSTSQFFLGFRFLLTDASGTPIAVPERGVDRGVVDKKAAGGRSADEHAKKGSGGPKPSKVIEWKIGEEMLGKGGNAEVFLGINLTNGELIAVKRVLLPPGLRQETPQPKDANEKQEGKEHEPEEEARRNKAMVQQYLSLQEEITVLSTATHPNIVRYYGSSRNKTYFNILLEFVPGGSLRHLLDNFGALNAGLVFSYLKQILSGLRYLHHLDIVHSDIKAANILITEKGKAKLTDFGTAKFLNAGKTGQGTGQSSATPGLAKRAAEEKKAAEAVVAEAMKHHSDSGQPTLHLGGTLRWMDPVLLRTAEESAACSTSPSGTDEKKGKEEKKAAKESPVPGPNKASDIWSVGCTMIEMMSGYGPWFEYFFESEEQIINLLLYSEEPPEVPDFPECPALVEICKRCLQLDASKRPNCEELLALIVEGEKQYAAKPNPPPPPADSTATTSGEAVVPMEENDKKEDAPAKFEKSTGFNESGESAVLAPGPIVRENTAEPAPETPVKEREREKTNRKEKIAK